MSTRIISVEDDSCNKQRYVYNKHALEQHAVVSFLEVLAYSGTCT